MPRSSALTIAVVSDIVGIEECKTYLGCPSARPYCKKDFPKVKGLCVYVYSIDFREYVIASIAVGTNSTMEGARTAVCVQAHLQVLTRIGAIVIVMLLMYACRECLTDANCPQGLACSYTSYQCVPGPRVVFTIELSGYTVATFGPVQQNQFCANLLTLSPPGSTLSVVVLWCLILCGSVAAAVF